MDKDSSMLEVLSHQIHVPVWWTAVCTRLGAKCRVAVVNTPTYSKVTTNGIRDNSGLEVLVWNAHACLLGYHRKLHGVRLSTEHIPKEEHAVLRSLLHPERVNSLFQQHSNVQFVAMGAYGVGATIPAIVIGVVAKGYVPIGERKLPAVFHHDTGAIRVFVVEGWARFAARRGDAVGTDDTSFGTLGGLARLGNGECRIVTAAHVVQELATEWTEDNTKRAIVRDTNGDAVMKWTADASPCYSPVQRHQERAALLAQCFEIPSDLDRLLESRSWEQVVETRIQRGELELDKALKAIRAAHDAGGTTLKDNYAARCVAMVKRKEVFWETCDGGPGRCMVDAALLVPYKQCAWDPQASRIQAGIAFSDGWWEMEETVPGMEVFFHGAATAKRTEGCVATEMYVRPSEEQLATSPHDMFPFRLVAISHAVSRYSHAALPGDSGAMAYGIVNDGAGRGIAKSLGVVSMFVTAVGQTMTGVSPAWLWVHLRPAA